MNEHRPESASLRPSSVTLTCRHARVNAMIQFVSSEPNHSIGFLEFSAMVPTSTSSSGHEARAPAATTSASAPIRTLERGAQPNHQSRRAGVAMNASNPEPVNALPVICPRLLMSIAL